MNNRKDFEARLRSYLSSGARTQPPAGMEERIADGVIRKSHSWAYQLMAAAAVILLAVGLGIAVNKARQTKAILPGGSPSASPVVSPSGSPSIEPTATASPEASNTPYPLLPPSSIRMVTSHTGWAAGSGTDRILRTNDGGTHWEDVTPRGARAGTWITHFLDANNAWLASSLQPGSGSADSSVEIYRTSNGGRSWQHAGTALADQGWPAVLDFVDNQHGWLFMRLGGAEGSDGVAFYGTADGGATWSKLAESDTSGAPGHLPLSCSKTAPVFLNSSTGWTPGACNAGGGPFLYVTHDSGQTWRDASIQLPAGYSGSCICEIDSLRFSDSRNGVFVLSIALSNGQRAVLYTTNDAGVSWRPGPVLPANAFTVYFIDAVHGWTLNAKENTILYSADGGQHWSTAGTIPSTEVVNDFQFVSSSVGWALGAEPQGDPILKTTDGGQTWTTQLAP